MFCTIKTTCVPIVQCNVSPHFVIVNLPIHIMELPTRLSQWPVTPEHSTPCGSQFVVKFFYETNTSKRFHMLQKLYIKSLQKLYMYVMYIQYFCMLLALHAWQWYNIKEDELIFDKKKKLSTY